MTQESKLLIKIDSQQAKRDTNELLQELNGLSSAGNKASNSTDQFGVSAKSAGNSAQGMAASVGTSTRALDEQAKRVRINTEGIKELAKVVMGFIAIDKGIAMADGYTQMAARIRIATSSTEEYNLVQKRLFETANTTYRSLAEAQEVYLGIESSIKLMGKTTTQALDVTDAMSFAFTANATSIDKAQSALNAYGRSLDKGSVGNDQWISIMQAIPGIASDISKYLKESGRDATATEQKIREMGVAGKVGVDLITDALEANKGKYKDLADSMDNSFKDGLTTLINSVTKFLGELNMATKGTNTFAAGLGILGENIDKVAIAGGIAASIYAGRLAQAFVISAQKAAWNTAAIVTQTGAMTTAATAAKNLYWALGGPVGVVVGVAGTVASMYLLRDSAKATTASIDTQGQSVHSLIGKYRELNELQRDNESKALASQLDDLSHKLTVASSDLSAFMEALPISDEKINTFRKLTTQFNQGKISSDAYYTAVKGVNILTKEQLGEVRNLISGYADSKKAFGDAGAAQDAFARSLDKGTAAIDKQLVSQQKLNEEQQSAYDKIKTQLERENYVKVNMKARNISRERAEFDADLRGSAGMGFTNEAGKMPEDLRQMGDAAYKLKQEAEARTKAEQATTKELKEQAKISKGLGNGMVSNSHLKGLPIKSGESTSGGSVRGYTAEFAQILGKELKGSIGAFTGFNDKYHQGKGGKHPQGQAFDLRLNNGANSANVDAQIKALADKYGYVVKTLDEYKNPSKNATGGHMHVSVTGRKGGSSSASDYLKQQKADIKDQKDAEREAEQAAKNRIQLEMNVADQVTKIKTKLAEDFKEIDKAGFSDDKAKALKAKYQAQADSEIELAKFALQTKLDDYSDFQKTEMQMLEKSYAQKKVYAAQDLELGATERKEAVVLLDKQLKQEQAMLMIAQEQRLFQMRQQFLTETQAMQERYRLEEAELIRVADLKEREFQRQMIRLRQEEESRARLQNAQMNWANVDAQMKGTTGRMQVDQDRFSRLDSSQQLFDSQMGAVDSGEQGALQRIQDQRSQELITEQEFENQKTLILQTALETRQAIYKAHALRQTDVEEAYQKDSINLQFTQAQQLTGSFANMFRGILGESSGAYRAMYAAQQSFAIAQAGMNMWSSASKAYNDSLSPTVWGRMADASKAMLDQGTFLAMIQSITPQGFSIGGYVRGPGTGTSDSIPAFLSDKEFVMKASAVEKIGVDNLNTMNRTGQLPQVQRERRQAQAIGAASSGDVINAPITVQVSVQADGSSSVDTQGQARQLGDMIGNAVRTVIRQEQRQGGMLSR